MTNNIKALNNFVSQRSIPFLVIIILIIKITIIIIIIIFIVILIITMMIIIHVITSDAHRFRRVVRYCIICSSFQFSLLEQWLAFLSPQHPPSPNAYIHNFLLNFLFIYKPKTFIMYHSRIKPEIETRVHVKNFYSLLCEVLGWLFPENELFQQSHDVKMTSY